MRKDPVCGMTGHIKKHNHYFCSVSCIRKYEGRSRWYKERIWQVSILVGAVLSISYLVPALNPILAAFWDYTKLIWWAIILGFILGGMIERYVPSEYVSKVMAGKRKRSIFYSAGLGILMSACSHGILALSIELYRKGASIPSVIAFLMAAPWANLTITFVLFGFFGINALFIIISAIVIAITTGFIYTFLERMGWIEKSPDIKVSKSFSILADIRRRWRTRKLNDSSAREDAAHVLRGAWVLAKMVLWWILLGMLLASIARAFVPVHIFQQYLGASLAGLFITLGLATLIEVCSEGSSPLAFEIYSQTGAFGNAFVFLMAGVATDYTEIGLLWTNIGKKTALWLPIVAGPQIVLLGYIFNSLL